MSNDRDDRLPGRTAELDRRGFLHATAAAAAFAVTAIAGPRSLTRAALRVGSAPGADRPELTAASTAHATSWSVDEIWGPTPPYALDVPHAPAPTSPILWEHVDPIDRMLVI